MNEAVRTWGLRLLALGIAIGLWFSVSFEDREVLSERLVEASVSYIRPKGLVILDPVQSVSVRLRGSSRQIRQLNPFMVDVQVDLTPGEEGLATVNLGPENVLMPEGLTLISIEPNVIRVELEREETKRIAVVPELVGQAAPGATVEEPEVFPNQVLVTGPESLLAKTEVLHTRPVSLAGKNATFEENVSVVAPDPLIQIVQPTRVSVRVPIQPAKPETPAENGAPKAQTEGS
ncbi:MAG TPA: CdaR family protein [Thermoanaerobaculia bacterium]|nr:CdaR family protein [Thermoanaerobaculia bacterium]